jgi:DNA repair protein RadA/Sms
MASKSKTIYVCNECGYQAPKWMGKCPECMAWNSFEEEIVQSPSKQAANLVSANENVSIKRLSEVDTKDEPRYLTGLSEFDRILGGGIVKGSLVLIGGDPGIGKSTLLLQICEYLCKDLSVIYFSGEESIRQIKLRADRLGVKTDNLYLVSQNNMDAVLEIMAQKRPDVVIIDSIQTMSLSSVTSSPGSISQVRECTQQLMLVAKTHNISTFIVGHVNKDGAIAGPKVLEHIVDAVLYFEGERHMSYRILRAVKNRFGSTNEIGMFEMCNSGLEQVENPSKLLLEDRPKNVSGTCVACTIQGSRPILSEVQALVAKNGFGTPRRTSTGFDYNRTYLLIAVLEKRAGYLLSTLDVYINVVGGLKLDEPAADLPVILSLYSGLKDKQIPDDLAAFGEIGLSGEVRSVGNPLSRINEIYKLGFSKCIIPKQNFLQLKGQNLPDIEIIPVSNIKEAFSAVE